MRENIPRRSGARPSIRHHPLPGSAWDGDSLDPLPGASRYECRRRGREPDENRRHHQVAVRHGRRPAEPRALHAAAAAHALPFAGRGSPVPEGRRLVRAVPRLPGAAQRRARSLQGRDPLSPRGGRGRGGRPGHHHDLEDRAGRYPVRRSEGRRAVRPAQAVAAGAGVRDPKLHAPDLDRAGALPGHPRPGHGHQRAPPPS